MEIIDCGFDELSAADLHALLKLRVDVFVVEQACAYPEIDGRDIEAATRHVWLPGAEGPRAYVRVLDDGAERRVGRVVTAPPDRGIGLAARLVDHVVATATGPLVLDAQSHLAAWYGHRGFSIAGEEFIEDGIPHVPMRRD